MTLQLIELSYFLLNRYLIKNISLTFQPGVLYGILGPNGSGKSTLLKTMSRLWHPTSGQLFWQGQDLLQFSRLAMSRTISLVPQNPSLYFDFTAYQMVAMGCYSLPSQIRKKYIEEALHEVDAWHLRNQFISHLSGGERQRIYIARTLATQAPILLLDEPVSNLDMQHQLEIWHLLHKLIKKGKLVIIATHDLATAQRFCDELIILHRGCCEATGSYDNVMTPFLLKTIFGIQLNSQENHFELSH